METHVEADSARHEKRADGCHLTAPAHRDCLIPLRCAPPCRPKAAGQSCVAALGVAPGDSCHMLPRGLVRAAGR